MNTNIDYSNIDLNKYFSFHYHSMGKIPIPNIKYSFMEKDNI